MSGQDRDVLVASLAVGGAIGIAAIAVLALASYVLSRQGTYGVPD